MTDDGTYLYYYDCENRLIDVNDQNDAAVASYSYDYSGRRVSKTVYGSPDVTTKYCYDGDQVIAEYDGNDTLLRKFVYGPGIDEPVCMIDVTDSNTVYYYHFDGLGSVVALSDSSGSIVEQYSYDVFGEPNRVSDVNNHYLFTGRRFDEETDNYYYRARYYSPEIGRFLQTDPLAIYMQYASVSQRTRASIPGTYLFASALQKFMQYDPIGRYLQMDPAGRFLQNMRFGVPVELNLYTYVGSNPIIFIDPQGLLLKGVIGGVVSGVGLAFTFIGHPYIGVPLVAAGTGLIVWDIYEDVEHPPGEDAFKDHTKQLEDAMDNYPVDGEDHDDGDGKKGS
ncbi:MAG: hypothetical protein JRI22_22005 [Deltaproteobacteria bacterium]|nr:hypothetical protein [Deltaproteobacteria bacterium]